MTVVEAYAGKKNLSPASDATQMHTNQSTLVIEGVALNTTGSVFVPKVNCICSLLISLILQYICLDTKRIS